MFLALLVLLGCAQDQGSLLGLASPSPAASPWPRANGVVLAVDAEADETFGGSRSRPNYRGRVVLSLRYQVGEQGYVVERKLPWHTAQMGTRDGMRLHLMGDWPVGMVVQVPYDPLQPATVKGDPEPTPYRIPTEKLRTVDMGAPLENWIRKVGQPAGGHADLALLDLGAPAEARAGQPVSLRVRLRNRGIAMAGNPRLVVREAGKVIGETTLSGGLPAGGEAWWILAWTPGRPGRAELEVQANPDEAIWESVYANNTRRSAITVTGASSPVASTATLTPTRIQRLPDLRVSNVKPRKPPQVGQRIWVDFTIANEGLVHTGGASLVLLEDGKEVARDALGLVLEPGRSWEERLAWTPGKAGKRTLRVVADPEGSIREGDDSNNAAEAAVEVVP